MLWEKAIRVLDLWEVAHIRRTQNATMKKLLHSTNRCELCNKFRQLEVHHIIPVAFGGPEDDVENMIVVCHKCHSLLTPHSILTKRGIDRVRSNNIFAKLYAEFYRTLYKFDGHVDLFDALDVFDKLVDKYSYDWYHTPAHSKEMRT